MAIDKSKMSDKQVAAGFAGSDAKGIQQLANALKAQNTAAQKKKTSKDRLDKLDELIKSSKFSDFQQRDVLNNLKNEFIASQERLQKAIEEGDEKLIALEEKNQDKLGSASSDLEKAREAEKATKKQGKLLQGIKDGVGSLGKSIKDNLLPGLGIGAIALQMFDPVKFKAIVDEITATLTSSFLIVKKILDRDFTGALETFKENFGRLSVLIGGLALYKFGFKGLAGGFAFFVTAIKGGLNHLKTGLGKVAAYLRVGTMAGPIALALAALLLAVTYGEDVVNKAKEEYDRTSSKFRALIAGTKELNSQATADVEVGLAKFWNSITPDSFNNKDVANDPEAARENYLNKARVQNDTLDALLTMMFNQKMETLKNVWNAILNAPSTFAQFKEDVKQKYKDIAAKATQAFDDTVAKSKEIFQQVREFPEKAKENIKKKFDEIYNMTTDAIQTAMDKASTQVDAAWTAAKTKYDEVKQKAKDLFESIRGNIESAYDKAKGFVSPAWEGAKKKYNIIGEKATKLFEVIKDKVKEALDYVFGLIKKALGIDEEKFEKLKQKAMTLGDQIYDRATTIFDSLIESMSTNNPGNIRAKVISQQGAITPTNTSGTGDELNDAQSKKETQQNQNNNNNSQPIVVPVEKPKDIGTIKNRGGGGRPSATKARQNNAFNYNSLDNSTSFA